MLKRSAASVTVIASVLLLLVSGGLAQTAAPATAPAPAVAKDVVASEADLLSVIPSDAAGFVMLKNGQSFFTALSQFVNAIEPSAAAEMERELRRETLGENLELNGAMAIVLLKARQAAASQPATDRSEEDIPVMFIVPGKDPMTMLAKFNPSQEDDGLVKFGKYEVIYAKAVTAKTGAAESSFVVMSFRRDAVANLKADGGITKRLSQADQAIYSRHDAFAWCDVKAAKAVLDSILVQERAPLEARMAIQAIWANVDSLASASAGVKFDAATAKGQAHIGFDANSGAAKRLSAYKPSDKPLINRLPDQPYLIKLGIDTTVKGPADQRQEQRKVLLSLIPGLPEDTKAAIEQATLSLDSELTGLQFFFGQAKQNGGIGLALVAECNSSDNLKKAIKDIVSASEACLALVPDDDFRNLSIKYGDQADTADKASIDAITFEHPDLNNQSEYSRRAMTNMLGEDKIRIYTSQVDAKTLLLTFGGASEFHKQAAKAATAGATNFDEHAHKTLAEMPKGAQALGLLSVTEFWNIQMGMHGAMMGGMSLPAVQPQPPVAAVGTADASGWNLDVVAPVDGFVELARAYKAMIEQMMAKHGGGPVVPSSAPNEMPD